MSFHFFLVGLIFLSTLFSTEEVNGVTSNEKEVEVTDYEELVYVEHQAGGHYERRQGEELEDQYEELFYIEDESGGYYEVEEPDGYSYLVYEEDEKAKPQPSPLALSSLMGIFNNFSGPKAGGVTTPAIFHYFPMILPSICFVGFLQAPLRSRSDGKQWVFMYLVGIVVTVIGAFLYFHINKFFAETYQSASGMFMLWLATFFIEIVSIFFWAPVERNIYNRNSPSRYHITELRDPLLTNYLCALPSCFLTYLWLLAYERMNKKANQKELLSSPPLESIKANKADIPTPLPLVA